MEPIAIIFMVLVLGFIWGGLAYLLNRAYRQEKQ